MLKKLSLTAVCLFAALSVKAANVYVVHGVPGANGFPVDIMVNRAVCAAQGVVFGDIKGPYTLPAGTYQLEVKPANAAAPCSGATALAGTVSLSENQTISVAAHLNTAGGPTLSVFHYTVGPALAGNSKFAVHHLANAPAVDLLLWERNDRGRPDITIPNLTNGKNFDWELESKGWALALAPAGTTREVFGPVRATMNPATYHMFFAIGDFARGTFRVIEKQILLE